MICVKEEFHPNSYLHKTVVRMFVCTVFELLPHNHLCIFVMDVCYPIIAVYVLYRLTTRPPKTQLLDHKCLSTLGASYEHVYTLDKHRPATGCMCVYVSTWYFKILLCYIILFFPLKRSFYNYCSTSTNFIVFKSIRSKKYLVMPG